MTLRQSPVDPIVRIDRVMTCAACPFSVCHRGAVTQDEIQEAIDFLSARVQEHYDERHRSEVTR